MKAAILAIGDELLIGQTIDTNSAWIGQNLYELNIEVIESRSISDEAEAIKRNLDELLPISDLILITGGLGPTRDDITKVTLAEYFGSPLAFHEETFARLTELFRNFGREPQDVHRIQCHLPTECEILKNRMGTAPGMLFEHHGKQIISMPGVPYEMKSIMTQEVLPRIEGKVFGAIYHKTIMTAGEGESYIADMIQDILDQMPPYMSIAYLPSLGTVRLRVTARGDHRPALKLEVDAVVDRLVQKLGTIAYGYDGLSLEENLMKLCNQHNVKLTTAESCTGGYVAHRITGVSGSSSYFVGGVVTYSNEHKMKHLGVEETTLTKHGAVSEETVREMAKGALDYADANLSISISGIAGPTGGSDLKPIGLIWMCVGSTNGPLYSFKIQASKDRLKNIEYAGNKALNALRLYIKKYYN